MMNVVPEHELCCVASPLKVAVVLLCLRGERQTLLKQVSGAIAGFRTHTDFFLLLNNYSFSPGHLSFQT